MVSKQRYVWMGFLGLLGVAVLVVAHSLTWLVGQANLPNPVPLAMTGVPITTLLAIVLVAMATYGMSHYAVARAWATEVVDELARVAWPSRQETGTATVVVVVAVLVCSAYLGLFDALWLSATDLVMGVHPAPAAN